jgi:hypothetical protein
VERVSLVRIQLKDDADLDRFNLKTFQVCIDISCLMEAIRDYATIRNISVTSDQI